MCCIKRYIHFTYSFPLSNHNCDEVTPIFVNMIALENCCVSEFSVIIISIHSQLADEMNEGKYKEFV